MSRNPNTTVADAPFHEATILDVWYKAAPVVALLNPYIDPKKTRKDTCGDCIDFAEYGHLTARGWEIDHIKPVAAGGGDELDNLQPLYWKTNRTKGDTYPWVCPESGKTGSGLIGRVVAG